MSNFKERLELETEQLEERLSKLDDFIESEKFKTIDPFQQLMLEIQLTAMVTYYTCLEARLKQLN